MTGWDDTSLALAAGVEAVEPREPVRLKGFEGDVPVFAATADRAP